MISGSDIVINTCWQWPAIIPSQVTEDPTDKPSVGCGSEKPAVNKETKYKK